MPLNVNQLATIEAIRSAATALWDVAETCWQVGMVQADDWEAARLTASHLVAVLDHPPAPTPLSVLRKKP